MQLRYYTLVVEVLKYLVYLGSKWSIQYNEHTSFILPRVVIIGGFAGTALAKKLKNKKKVQVVLLDATNHHTFQPLLYQVATGG
jgi:NADH dehydrogenase